MEVNDSQGVLERVAARDARRRAELDKAVQERQTAAPEAESAAAFLGAWQPRCSQLETQLASTLGELQSKQEKLQACAAELESLEQDLAAAAYYLPNYDSKQAQATLDELHSQLSTLKSKNKPKAKFSFGSKAKVKAPPRATPAADDIPAAVPPPPAPSARGATDGNLPQVSGEVITMHNHQLEGRDITLSDMHACQIFLLGSPAALRLKNMHACQLVSGPVSGASFLDGVCACSIWLASRQVRIHDSQNCQVYLRTASRPIIEDCSGMAFAPWQALSYEGAEGQLQAAQLQQDSGLWGQVQDFRWLRATPSPHWSVIAEQDRQRSPEIPAAQL